jgi:hypothetical protein
LSHFGWFVDFKVRRFTIIDGQVCRQTDGEMELVDATNSIKKVG